MMTPHCFGRLGFRTRAFCAPLLATVAVGIALCLTGCSRHETANPVDPKPFEAAIADYLQSKSFGMKVVSVERIEQKGDTATAMCRMQDADGTYALKVRWEFTFRHNAGGWQVENYTAK